MDAASVTLAEASIDVEPGATTIPFSIGLAESVDFGKTRLTIWVHVDVDGDGVVVGRRLRDHETVRG